MGGWWWWFVWFFFKVTTECVVVCIYPRNKSSTCFSSDFQYLILCYLRSSAPHQNEELLIPTLKGAVRINYYTLGNTMREAINT